MPRIVNMVQDYMEMYGTTKDFETFDDDSILEVYAEMSSITELDIERGIGPMMLFDLLGE
jgi:hypothetical protein